MAKKSETQMYHEGSSYYGKGHGKPSNLPTEVEMKAYPNPYESLDNDSYPDTLEEVDENQRSNNKQIRAHKSRSMY